MSNRTVTTFAVGYLQTNCYVISDGKVAVVVDPGGSGEKILGFIERSGFQGRAVLLTHGHFDHIMALSDFSKAGYEVCIHCADEKMLRNEGNLSDMVGLGALPVVTPTRCFSDGESLRFGDMVFSVIHTPGHTPGSSCFDLDGEYLFSGDTLFCHSHGRTDFPGGSESDMLSSLRRLFALPGDRTVYCGHGPSTTLADERAFFSCLL